MSYDALILGIGNLLWADEGFGVRAVEALHARYSFGDNISVMDGGTQGIFLLPAVRSTRRLLIFDAVDFGDPPATLRLIEGDDVPRFMGAKKVSMHQAGFQEVLFSAELAGGLPEDLALIGVQPELLDDYGGSLTPSVRKQIEPAVKLACEVLDRWGIEYMARTSPPQDLVGPGALDINDYEQGRPMVGENSR
ncbi:MAG: HyaD/HybD family hydrogenase maturation endopeptidase [Woeseiaceae bacterium]|nr:HyaD/HybD family hydrogenase maturation endopeptidase [Woeseiaceae bacterium]